MGSKVCDNEGIFQRLYCILFVNIIKEQPYPIDDRACPGILEHNANSARGTAGSEEYAFIAYSGCVDKCLPAISVAVGFDSESLYPLAEGDILLQHDAVEGNGVVKGEGKRRGDAAVVDSPVGVVICINDVGGSVIPATCVGGGDYGFGCKVLAEDAVEGGTEFHQPQRVGTGYQSPCVGRHVEQQ